MCPCALVICLPVYELSCLLYLPTFVRVLVVSFDFKRNRAPCIDLQAAQIHRTICTPLTGVYAWIQFVCTDTSKSTIGQRYVQIFCWENVHMGMLASLSIVCRMMPVGEEPAIMLARVGLLEQATQKQLVSLLDQTKDPPNQKS